MTPARRRLIAAFASALVAATGIHWWQQRSVIHYLSVPPAEFALQFAPPAAANSAVTRAELDELLALQLARTPEQVAAARADRKTEIERFFVAVGIDSDAPPQLPHLRRLAEHVEDDVRIYVRAVKDRFRRLRPYEIEPRLKPCIDNVQGDLSYPSGHAAFGYSMAYLFTSLVPERRQTLEARADEFARQRMVCGVHFRSDLEAGRRAAQWLLAEMSRNPEFRAHMDAAAAELRSTLPKPRRFGHVSSIRRSVPFS